MRRTKEEALETRKAILTVALDCFSKRGYALTTFNDIARRIHLTKGAVFWHFKSKEELLAELIEREHATYEPLRGVREAESLEAVRDAFVDWARAMEEHRELRQVVIFMMSRVEWSEALKQRLARKLDRELITDPISELCQCLGRLKERGAIDSPLAPEQIATLMAGAFFEVLRGAWLHKIRLDVVKTVEAGLDFIVKGIRSK